MKACTSCKGSGPFGPSKTGKDGLKSICKKCLAEKQRAYTAKHPEIWKHWAEINAEKLRVRDAARYAADPEKEKRRVLVYQKENPEKVKAWQLQHLYGLTPEDKQALFDRQGGRCAVCRDELKTGRTGMQVDHKHDDSKTVRGLLCHPCNRMLGHFKDSSSLFAIAVQYLQRGLVGDLPKRERPRGAEEQGTPISNLWYGYGLTFEDLDILLERQGGGCGICRSPLTSRGSTHIDHDHKLDKKTGIRGLLCRMCNLGLGQSREDVSILQGAIKYLVVH